MAARGCAAVVGGGSPAALFTAGQRYRAPWLTWALQRKEHERGRRAPLSPFQCSRTVQRGGESWVAATSVGPPRPEQRLFCTLGGSVYDRRSYHAVCCC